MLLAVDLGTTSLKTCLYEVGDRLTLLAATSRPLALVTAPDGTAEQDPADWWAALVDSVPELLARTATPPDEVGGLTFCAQMQCLVLVDESGEPVRPALSYLDQRPTGRMPELTRGGPRVAGIGATLLLPWLRVAGGVAASAKDPLWKYLRVADEEPQAFRRVHRWLDAKDYLTARCTGRFTMSSDSAFATFLADTRDGRLPVEPVAGRTPRRAPRAPAGDRRAVGRGRRPDPRRRRRAGPRRRDPGLRRRWGRLADRRRRRRDRPRRDPRLRRDQRLGLHRDRSPHRGHPDHDGLGPRGPGRSLQLLRRAGDLRQVPGVGARPPRPRRDRRLPRRPRAPQRGRRGVLLAHRLPHGHHRARSRPDRAGCCSRPGCTAAGHRSRTRTCAACSSTSAWTPASGR